jgi:HK97 gp10 family phage protein
LFCLEACLALEYSGFDTLQKRLQALKAELSTNGMKRVVRAGAKVFKGEMVRRAPVLAAKTPGSNALEPGALKAGIRTALLANETPVTALVGPNKKVAHVARFVEYGHREVRSGIAHGDVPAHPFIRPAYESARSEAESAMVAEVNAMVRESENA